MVGDSQLGKGGGGERGGGLPGAFQLLFPSESGVIKFAFCFFLRYNFFVVSAIVIAW